MGERLTTQRPTSSLSLPSTCSGDQHPSESGERTPRGQLQVVELAARPAGEPAELAGPLGGDGAVTAPRVRSLRARG